MPVPATDPIIVAPTPTPFGPDEQIDHERLARNIERWLNTRLSEFVVGSAGSEEFYLSDDERAAPPANARAERRANSHHRGGAERSWAALAGVGQFMNCPTLLAPGPPCAPGRSASGRAGESPRRC